MSTSFRSIFRHTEPYPVVPSAVRTVLRKPAGRLRIRVTGAPFSVMCQNMGLLVFPAPYLGVNRQGAIDELVRRIAEISPDVVGLCEVFDDGERAKIARRLKSLYPHSTEGPDEGLIREDSGLLLLSKHRFEQPPHRMVYQATTSWDQLTRKGVVHARLQVPGCPLPIDFFFTHAQDIEPAGGREALYDQLSELNQLVEQQADPRAPTIIFGDINVPGESPQHYAVLLNRLRKPVDLWVVNGNPENVGFTLAAENNFYADLDDNPKINRRVDYVLMRAGSRVVPLLEDIQILRLQHAGRAISDHYGLFAVLKSAVLLEE